MTLRGEGNLASESLPKRRSQEKCREVMQNHFEFKCEVFPDFTLKCLVCFHTSNVMLKT